MSPSSGLVLLTWCDPWLIGLPISSVKRIASPEDLFTPTRQEITADLGVLLGLTPDRPRTAVGSGSWVVVDRQTPVALRVDRCLQVIDPRIAVTPVPGGLLRGTISLGCFPLLAPVAGLDESPEFSLWLDPALLSLAPLLGHRP